MTKSSSCINKATVKVPLVENCQDIADENPETGNKLCSRKFSDSICRLKECKKQAKKCIKALKSDAKTRVSQVCPGLCDKKCGKFHITLDCIVDRQF